jgi:hypothetical protein
MAECFSSSSIVLFAGWGFSFSYVSTISQVDASPLMELSQFASIFESLSSSVPSQSYSTMSLYIH